MTPSRELKELLETGSTTGWHLHERSLAMRLLAGEASSDLVDSVRRETRFLQDEQLLPATNVAGIMRSVQRDPGPDGAPGFSHEATGDWRGLKKQSPATK